MDATIVTKVKGKVLTVLRHKGIIRTKKEDNPLKWGIIGLGNMAETFATAIDGSRKDVVYAVASRDIQKAKAFSANHGQCKAYGSYAEMVNDDNLGLDVIYIATPAKYHYEHVKLCLEAGKNVLCEKPFTSVAGQLEGLMAIAREKGCFLMEGMWMKCLPPFKKAERWIREGRIGAPELVKVDFYKREHIQDVFTIYNAKEGGGVLRDYGVYAIAFMTHFLGGVPDGMSAYCRKSEKGLDTDWQISASRAGVHTSVNISSNFDGSSKAAVIGRKGIVEWESQFNRTNRVSLYGENGLLVETFKTNYKFSGYEYEVDEVRECIRAGKKESAVVNLGESLAAIEVIDTLMKGVE